MNAKILWFTGLSGSGKTTLAHLVFNYLKKYKKNCKIKKIDGDIFRKKKKLKSFSKETIIQNNLNIINYIKSISSKYNFILVSVISPLIKTRKIARKTFLYNYYEIHTKCSISTLIKRDTKQLYKLAKKKELKNLIGYNSPIKYQLSSYKILTINTGRITKKKSLDKIIKYIT